MRLRSKQHTIASPLRNAIDRVDLDVPDELVAALDPLARGESPGSLDTSRYVVHSLQTALHDALSAESAEEAIITAVNRGGDTDTIGAIAGAAAGARFGASALPGQWIFVLDDSDRLADIADQLVTIV